MAGQRFDAAEQTRKLIPTEIEISGRTFNVRRTGSALKAIIEMSPDEEPQDQNASENIDLLYRGLSYLLVDPDSKEHPETDWLAEELDFEVAQQLMEKFVPRGEPGNADGSAKEPSTPT